MNAYKQLEAWRSRDPKSHSYAITMVEGRGSVQLLAGYCPYPFEAICPKGATTSGLEEVIFNLLSMAILAESNYILTERAALNRRASAVMSQSVEMLSWESPKQKLDYYTPPARQLCGVSPHVCIRHP